MILPLIFSCQSVDIKNSVIDSSVESTDTSVVSSIFDWDSVNTELAIRHLEALQDIADQNGGNRAAGTSGYDESVEYVTQVLSDAGYSVTEFPFSFNQYQLLEDPSLSVSSELYNELSVLYYSPAGNVRGPIAAVNVMIPHGNQPNSSSSGCSSDDFNQFETGSIALIQRGTCTFLEKVQFAQDAGAIAVILFNEGQNGREDVLEGTLGSPDSLTIPVIGVSYDTGVSIYSQVGEEGHVVVDSVNTEVSSVNVFAERDAGDPMARVVIGAHLDSVQRGPGINDNGTGVASLLTIAKQFSDESHMPNQRVQFAFWGAEELGLIGSYSYVGALSEVERKEIVANLNFDMVGSPNYVRFIYDGDGSSSGDSGPAGSDLIERQFELFYDGVDLPYASTPFDGRSDYGPFIAAGIPAGGLFTGAEGIKDEDEALYGGDIGEPYDACYHESCDTIENVNSDGLKEMLAATYAVSKWASEDDALLNNSKSKREPMQLDRIGDYYIR